MPRTDVVVIGGGIVGLATAYRIGQQFPHMQVMVLEKEAAVAEHQTGRNSGVLHSGIYYKPGTLRAKNCRTGKQAMVDFCREEGVDHDVCGKVIVAVDETELPNLQRIYERGQANGVTCEMIGKERLKELEPHVAGVRAIHVPEAGIVNYRQVCQKLAEKIEQAGGQVIFHAKVLKVDQRPASVVLSTTAGTFEADWAVNCAGLHCDRVTQLAGDEPQAKIIPFRGEYYALRPDAYHLCRNLIYPVPDPAFPFLGVHFTRMTDGTVECGPNAVLALAREGYTWKHIQLGDLWESLAYRGFQRLAGKYWRMGLNEMWRSLSKAAFVRALQRLIPEVQADQLSSAPSGVRAQAVLPDGQIMDDFIIQRSRRMVHVGNAPSPAATSALNVGQLITDQLAEAMA